MKDENMVKADFITSIVLLSLGIVIVTESIRMPISQGSVYSAPGIVPGLLGGVLILFSLILLIRSIIKKGYKIEFNKVKQSFRSVVFLRLFLTILISVVYASVLIGRIPYIIATFLYVFVFIFVFDYDFSKSIKVQIKKITIMSIVAILTSVSISAVFQYLFLVELP